jgi:hypothetical protein
MSLGDNVLACKVGMSVSPLIHRVAGFIKFLSIGSIFKIAVDDYLKITRKINLKIGWSNLIISVCI